MMRDVGSGDDEVCAQCLKERGLCDKHKRYILPQLARNLGWLRLMGEAQVEQVARQTRRADAATKKAMRREARKHARSNIACLVVHVRTAA